MSYSRIIPCLLISSGDLVKTVKFKNPRYIGDPVNAARIFSDKEVDEIVVLDIGASRLNKEPDYDLIAEISGECFMPLSYGGGVRTVEQVKRLIRSGVEKVVICTQAFESTNLIEQSAELYGNQAIVGGLDVKRNLFGKYQLTSKSGTVVEDKTIEQHVESLVRAGVGEILINNVDRDGMMFGYDLKLIKRVSSVLDVPVIACGGAGSVEHLRLAIEEGGASAAAAGSLFVYHGKHRAVLINYPKNIRF